MDEKDCKEVEITEEDIKEAFKELKTYIDISIDDFKEIYLHALRHANKKNLNASADGNADNK